MNICGAHYSTLAARDERLAVLFGAVRGKVRPRGSLIEKMNYSNLDVDGTVLARGILRQVDRYPEAFSRVLEAYDLRMAGALPKQALQEGAEAAGYTSATAFLYGISQSVSETLRIEGAHGLLTAILLGDIEEHVMSALCDLTGTTRLNSLGFWPSDLDIDEEAAREVFCERYVGPGQAYTLLKAGVSPAMLRESRDQAYRSTLMAVVAAGADAVYAAEAMRAGIGPEAILAGWHSGVPIEYLAATLA